MTKFRSLIAVLLSIFLICESTPMFALDGMQDVSFMQEEMTEKVQNQKNEFTQQPEKYGERGIALEVSNKNPKEGEYIEAKIYLNHIESIAGYEVNLKYNPQALKPVEPKKLEPFGEKTFPQKGEFFKAYHDKEYVNIATNDLEAGSLNFGCMFWNPVQDAIKNDVPQKKNRVLAKVLFKVLKPYETQIVLENAKAMEEGVSGTVLYDSNGKNKIKDYKVIQGPLMNQGGLKPKPTPEATPKTSASSSTTESTMLTQSSLTSTSDMQTLTEERAATIQGHVLPEHDYVFDVNSGIQQNFQVVLDTASATTNAYGYYGVTNTGGTTLTITKPGYLKRQVTLPTNADYLYPIYMWAGDVDQNDAINMTDVMTVMNLNGKVSGDSAYREDCDFNRDGIIDQTDVDIAILHFNQTPANYPAHDNSA